MKKRFYLVITLGVLLCLYGHAEAQTIYGPGGLFVHPSAFVPARGEIGLNVSWFTQKAGSTGRAEWLPISLTAGATEKLEIGALDVNRFSGGRHRDSGGVFAKYQLVADSPTRPAIAIAGSFLGGDVRQSALSGVISHRFLQGERTIFIGHIGVQWARRADIPIAQDDIGGFVGLEVPMTRGLSLVGEVGTRFRFDRNSTSAVGLMWTARNGVHIGVGYVNTGRSDDDRFFVGVGYPFGGSK